MEQPPGGDPRGGVVDPGLLRRGVLALAVLDDVDLTPRHDGVDVGGGGFVSWQDIHATLGAWVARPGHPVARARLLALVTVARLISGGGPVGLASAMRVHVEPPGSALYPAGSWPVARVGAGPVVAGWGLLGVPGARWTRPLPPVPTVQAAVRVALATGILDWRARRARLDRCAELLAERLSRDAAAGRPLVLRPVAEADVATMLLSRGLRSFLAGIDGSGMAALALPARSRGWSDVRRVDPAFVRTAWHLTDPLERAFGAPLLVTADDVVLPRGIGDALGSRGHDLAVDPLATDAGRS